MVAERQLIQSKIDLTHLPDLTVHRNIKDLNNTLINSNNIPITINKDNTPTTTEGITTPDEILLTSNLTIKLNPITGFHCD